MAWKAPCLPLRESLHRAEAVLRVWQSMVRNGRVGPEAWAQIHTQTMCPTRVEACPGQVGAPLWELCLYQGGHPGRARSLLHPLSPARPFVPLSRNLFSPSADVP